MSEPVLSSPPVKRKKTSDVDSLCILCSEICNETQTYTVVQWEKLKEKTEEWKRLDKYGNVYDTINWDEGPSGKNSIFHRKCVTYLQTNGKLTQAKIRLQKSSKVLAAETGDDSPSPCQLESADISDNSRSTRKSTGILHDKDKCVFCMLPDNHRQHCKGNPWHRIEQKRSWYRLSANTIHIADEDTRKRLNTFFATIPNPESAFGADIYYHKKCWDKYVSHASSKSHPQNVCSRELRCMFIAHVRSSIFELNEARTLKGLLLDYQNMFADFGQSADGAKSSWIKKLLQDEFGDKVGFHNRFQKLESTLVFDKSQGGSFLEAALNSWGIPLDQLLRNVARRIHEQMKTLPKNIWPPTVQELEDDEITCNFLTKFVGWLKSPGRNDPELSPKVRYVASALQSLICKDRTTEQIKLTSTLYGLTRNKELVNLMNRAGFGISYDDIKNLYASWAKHDIDQGSAPPQIASNVPGTVVVDNDDFKCDTLTGKSVAEHRTNVMFVHPETLSQLAPQMSRPVLTRHDQLKDIVTDINTIRPYKTVQKGVPPIRKKFDIAPSTTNEMRSLQLQHTLCRMTEKAEDVDPQEQRIGSFAGFQATLTDGCVKSKAVYWLTLPKPPHKSVLHEVMERLQKVIEDRGMPFPLLVGDQPVYALIVQLRNENPEKFKKIIPYLGPFHTQVAFITAIAKRFEGSGLSDIIVSAEVITEKSVDRALRGKHYRCIVRVLQLVYETLQRRIIRQGLENGLTLSKEIKDCLNTLRNPKSERQSVRDAAEELCDSEEFASFMEQAYATVGGTPMGEYWLSFMQMVEILVMNIHSTKTKNWDQFKASLRLMLPWMLVYDRNKYGKWLPEFLSEISTLPDNISEHMESIFSQSMTGHPYSRIPLDLWIEMSMNKGSKMKAGWKSILQNETMLTTHILNANYVNRVRVSLHKSLGMKIHGATAHKENTKRRLRVDELAVQDLDKCIAEFECNPFDQNNIMLRTLQSGEIASEELQFDLQSAHDDGESIVRNLFEKRIFSREEQWDSVMHNNSRKTFLSPSIKGSTTAKATNVAKMENEAMADVIAKCCDENITLTDIMQHRVTTECLSIFNTSGTIIKNQKLKVLQMLSYVPIPLNELLKYAAIIDMGMIWRLTLPTLEERDKGTDTEFTWRDYAEKMFNTIVNRHKAAEIIFMVNDPYDVKEWIKGDEQVRRSAQVDPKYKYGSKNVFWKPGDKLPNARDLARFFTNKKNKMRLQQFIQGEFERLSQHLVIKMIYSIQNQCQDLNTRDRQPMYECNLPEADQIMFRIPYILRDVGYQNAIVYDVADTDVIIQSAFVAQRTEGVLGVLRKHVVFDCKHLCPPDVSKVIVALHYLTGSDSTSGFFGHGKKMAMKMVKNNLQAQELLKDVGARVELSSKTLNDITKFVIRYIYNDKISSSLSESRALLWKRMKRKSTQRIPPDDDSLKFHAMRCNYITNVCMNSYMQHHSPPSPNNYSWTNVDGQYHPVRHTLPSLPQRIEDILCSQPAEMELGLASDGSAGFDNTSSRSDASELEGRLEPREEDIDTDESDSDTDSEYDANESEDDTSDYEN